MKYEIDILVYDKIDTFYVDVSKKYKHTYSEDLMLQNISDAYQSIYLIETSNPKIISHRDPKKSNTKKFKEWSTLGYLVATTKKWHYAYTIENDTIIVHDACHQQNNESIQLNDQTQLLYEKLCNIITTAIVETFEYIK